jgi:dTDP-4-dehydrorhamnose 3,5-epimerase/CDP-3, 6-dideoxy-D-glycero-D-glycero-4-hexulose-5-epimerase
MELITELLPGCFLMRPKKFTDQRGCFLKTYQEKLCAELGVNLQIREEFYSVSHKNVVRGMHFQLPPQAHEKLVYCTRGTVCDVMLDLRRGDSYGHIATAQLSGENGHLIFIPKGIAHGFVALTDDSLMLYKTSTEHAPEFDCGIRWDTFGFDWEVDQPIISDRDRQHIAFSDFVSPF